MTDVAPGVSLRSRRASGDTPGIATGVEIGSNGCPQRSQSMGHWWVMAGETLTTPAARHAGS
jgi:hypothetical protein